MTTVTEELILKALSTEEVLISWYFGDKVSYVWAITKDKPPDLSHTLREKIDSTSLAIP